MNAVFRMPQRGTACQPGESGTAFVSHRPNGASAYQPRATPWEIGTRHSCVLKERRIPSVCHPAPDRTLCAVPSERMDNCCQYPGLHPGLVCGAPLGQKCASPWGLNYVEEPIMPQSLSNILIHLIWSTKERHPWLEPGIREKTHAFLAGAVRQCDCESFKTTPEPSITKANCSLQPRFLILPRS